MIGDAWTPPVIVTIDDERANASNDYDGGRDGDRDTFGAAKQ